MDRIHNFGPFGSCGAAGRTTAFIFTNNKLMACPEICVIKGFIPVFTLFTHNVSIRVLEEATEFYFTV